MRNRKQKFSCNHIGWGTYCHRCQTGKYLLKLLKLSNDKRKTLTNSKFAKMTNEQLKNFANSLLQTEKSSRWRVSSSNKFIEDADIPELQPRFKNTKNRKKK